ncbi:MAG: 2-C-methyl-D-erythritol 4-phosphate cytidylyltransferase [Deltaproteobacteria bacterium]|nr:2-C-methyl-D-erythritol 4-phosphate cytidylyltransferase [Deltaproteobacteria bacterium]
MGAAVLIPAAGRGRRMGGERPKAFLPLGGIPILARTLRKFEACALVEEIFLLVPASEIAFCAEEVVRPFGLRKVSRILAGGAERQDSVFLGLQELGERAETVLIHDGARPFVPPSLIESSIREAGRWPAVTAAIPAGETIKEVSAEGVVRGTLPRERLWIVQTPQAFAGPVIREAHARAKGEGFYATDDAGLVERIGVPVRILIGSRFNLKFTTPEDLLIGEALLKMKEDL